MTLSQKKNNWLTQTAIVLGFSVSLVGCGPASQSVEDQTPPNEIEVDLSVDGVSELPIQQNKNSNVIFGNTPCGIDISEFVSMDTRRNEAQKLVVCLKDENINISRAMVEDYINKVDAIINEEAPEGTQTTTIPKVQIKNAILPAIRTQIGLSKPK